MNDISSEKILTPVVGDHLVVLNEDEAVGADALADKVIEDVEVSTAKEAEVPSAKCCDDNAKENKSEPLETLKTCENNEELHKNAEQKQGDIITDTESDDKIGKEPKSDNPDSDPLNKISEPAEIPQLEEGMQVNLVEENSCKLNGNETVSNKDTAIPESGISEISKDCLPETKGDEIISESINTDSKSTNDEKFIDDNDADVDMVDLQNDNIEEVKEIHAASPKQSLETVKSSDIDNFKPTKNINLVSEVIKESVEIKPVDKISQIVPKDNPIGAKICTPIEKNDSTVDSKKPDEVASIDDKVCVEDKAPQEAPIESASLTIKKVVPIVDNNISAEKSVTNELERRKSIAEKVNPTLIERLSSNIEISKHSMEKVSPAIEKLSAVIGKISPVVENRASTSINLVQKIGPSIEQLSSVMETESVVEKIESVVDRIDPAVEKMEPIVGKIEQMVEMVKPQIRPVNGDFLKEEHVSKRRASEDADTESPLKKLCQEVERTFPKHDAMINEYVQSATKNSIDELQRHTEQLLSEIQTLRELAQKKEHEWNNILHLKKVKEEILLRLLRKKQVISFEKSAEMNGSNKDPLQYLLEAKNLAIDKSDEISGLALKPPTPSNLQPPPPNIHQPPPGMPVNSPFNPMSGLPPPYDKAHMQNMGKPMFPPTMMMPGPTMPFPREMNGALGNFGLPMGRQGPTKDVKSIIADYRQRNPDLTPRRGRRMKSILNPNMMNAPRQIAPKMDNMNLNNMGNLGLVFNNLDMNQKAMLERLTQMQAANLPNGMSFKDVLVQFANIQQHGGMMPPRPEMMHRPEQHQMRPDSRENRRRTERPPAQHEEQPTASKGSDRPSVSPRLPPPPYPEISLLPVSNQEQQTSLLHGILTKQAGSAQSFSPTLAKLLTSPERKQGQPTLPTFGQAKNCGEITITPVQPTPPPPEQQEKTEDVVQLDDSESPQSEESNEDTAGRLVIDEAGGAAGAGAGGGGGEPTPLCQGCRRRDAQFVCAGCANQWYCSRDCQVAAWDDHSEMCSG